MDDAPARADSVTGDTAKAVVAVIGLLVTGVVWAFGAIVGGAVLDGIPPDDYGPGDRFFFGIALLLLTPACPTLSLLGYHFARNARWSRPRSFAVAQAAAGAIAVPAFLFVQ